MQKEKKMFGAIHDGSGKRYDLFCLYFILGDLEKSSKYFNWYKSEFPDDGGEPFQKLCWALSLFRMNHIAEAKYKLADLMLTNLYLIPNIIGQPVREYDIWHYSSDTCLEFANYLPDEVRNAIKASEIDWITQLYQSPEFSRIRERFIEIYHELLNVQNISKRRELLAESYKLLEVLQ